MQAAFILANGEVVDGPMVRQALAAAPDATVIAADGGARIAAALGLQVDFVIGDMDSLDPDELAQLEAKGAHIRKYPEEKNETDLELTLTFATKQGVDWMRIFGATGGRLDQMLGNIYLLALPALNGRDVRLVAGSQETWLLETGENVVQGAAGDTLSLIPLSGSVHGIRTENLYYPLRDETLSFGPARGISNVMVEAQARVWVGDGRLLAVHTIGRA
ncbi:MAG: thiamine diphosphokinase [Anaerolineae bacterium]|nr:thiamine diphosphokinase [Anaerolineae bacterium]